MATRDSSQPTAHTDENGDVILDRVPVTEPAPAAGVVTNGPRDPGDDRDGDGLSDQYEDTHGTDSFNPDSDGDGLGDGDEKRYGTDAHNADSDGDGVKDGTEVEHHSNPLSTDTDGDGYSDGTEYGWGFPDAASVPNPANATPDDIDGDGVSNRAEQIVGTSVLADGSKLAGGPGDAALVQQYYDAHKTGDAGHDLTLRQELDLEPTKADEDALLTQVGDEIFSADIVARERGYEILNEQYGEKAPPEHDEAYAKYQSDLADATLNRDEAAYIRAEAARGHTPTAEELAQFKAPSQTDLFGIERQQQLLGNETPADSPLAAVEAKVDADATAALVDHDREAFIRAAGAKGPTKEDLARFDHPTTADVLGAAHQASVMGTPVPDGSYLAQATTHAIDQMAGGNAPTTAPATGASTSTTDAGQGADRVDRGDPSASVVDHSRPTTSTSTGSTSTSTGPSTDAAPVPASSGSAPAPVPTGDDVVVTNAVTGETTITRSDGSVTSYGAGGEVTYDSRAEHDAVAAGGSNTDWHDYLNTPAKTSPTGDDNTTTVTVEAPDGSSTTATTPTTTTTTPTTTTTTTTTTSGGDDDEEDEEEEDTTTTTTTTSTTTTSGSDDDDTTTTEEDDADEEEMQNPDDATTLTGHTADVIGVIDEPTTYIGPGDTDGVDPASGFGNDGIDGTVDPHRADPFGGTRDPSGDGDPTDMADGTIHVVAEAQPEGVRPDLEQFVPVIEGPPDDGVTPYADAGTSFEGADHLAFDDGAQLSLGDDASHLALGVDVHAGLADLDAPDDGMGFDDDGGLP